MNSSMSRFNLFNSIKKRLREIRREITGPKYLMSQETKFLIMTKMFLFLRMTEWALQYSMSKELATLTPIRRHHN